MHSRYAALLLLLSVSQHCINAVQTQSRNAHQQLDDRCKTIKTKDT